MYRYFAEVITKLYTAEVPDYFVELFELNKKSEVEKYCRSLTIQNREFVKLIVSSYKIGYRHRRQNYDFTPTHLYPKDDELAALKDFSAGDTLTGKSKKFFTKTSQIFKDRRLLVLHLFFNDEKWHLFYYDQRDLENLRKNHWSKGPHIHFVNYLWPNCDINKLSELFNNQYSNIGKNIHIKYIE